MLIATFRLELDAVALGRAFEEAPGMAVEAERIAAHSTQWTMPCFWIAAEDFDAVDDALRADPSVDRIVETAEFDDETYYHLDWSDAVDERVNAYVDREGSILQAEATAEGWEVQIRFTSRDQFDAFREALTERGHSFALLALFEPGAARESIGDLTPSQRDALVAAAEHGYYEVPRRITMRQLASELDVSHQSLSELLRRGTEKLIGSELVTDHGD